MNVLEIHMIQSIPASNINRGEDGDTKTACFGGVDRQRVSSQAWKRPIRTEIQTYCQENSLDFGLITKKIEQRIREKCPNVNEKKFTKILEELKISQKQTKKDESDKKDVLMYLSEKEIQRTADYINDESEENDKELKEIVKDSKNQIPLDIALFGRMFASNPELNVYGALKMSHAISTHAVELEDDYFTAVDQLDSVGAGHIGHNTFTSSTMYRYFAIDLDLLKTNLGDDVKPYIQMIIKAIITAFPKGKENSFAAYTRPSFINLILKNGQPYQYVNAFESPIEADGEGYIKPSIEAYKTFKHSELSIGLDDVILDLEIDQNNSFQISIDTLLKVI